MPGRTVEQKQEARFLKLYESSVIADRQILFHTPEEMVQEFLATKGADGFSIYLVNSDGAQNIVKDHPGIHMVDLDSDDYMHALATSKYIVSTRLIPDYFIRKDNQLYINIWADTTLSTMQEKIISHFQLAYSEQHSLLQASHILFSNMDVRDQIVRMYNLDTLYTGEIVTDWQQPNPVKEDCSGNKEKRYSVIFPGAIKDTSVLDTMDHLTAGKDMIAAIRWRDLTPMTGGSLFDDYCGLFSYLIIPTGTENDVTTGNKHQKMLRKRSAFGELNIGSRFYTDYYNGEIGETFRFKGGLSCVDVTAEVDGNCLKIHFPTGLNLTKILIIRHGKIYWARELTAQESQDHFINGDFTSVLLNDTLQFKEQYTLAAEYIDENGGKLVYYLKPDISLKKDEKYCLSPLAYDSQEVIDALELAVAVLPLLTRENRALGFTLAPTNEAAGKYIKAQIVDFSYQQSTICASLELNNPGMPIKNVVMLDRNASKDVFLPMEYSITEKGAQQKITAKLDISLLHLENNEEGEWEIKVIADACHADNAVTPRLGTSLLSRTRGLFKLNNFGCYYKSENGMIFFPRKTRKGRKLIYMYTAQSKGQFLRQKWWGIIRRFLRSIVRRIIYTTYHMLYRLVPIDDKLVIFISFTGGGYSDNPKAIYEAMRKDPRLKDFRYIWFIKGHKKKKIKIEGAEVKEYYSVPYFYYMSKAKYWIINCKMPRYIRKKKDQIYLQTWHGTPLKRLAHDIVAPEGATFYRSGMDFNEMVDTYDVDVKKYNYMISPNKFCTEVFQSAFQIDKYRLIETGYPRNDFITNATPQDVEEIKKRYKIPLDKKVVLYAPTWRDNSFVAKGYTFDLKADFHKWKDILGPEYVVIFKPHYLIINKYEKDKSLKEFLYSAKAEAEINELYVISDILVTDYSSVFFDYAVLNRPIYFYMYDLEDYRDELRGFYLDIYKDLPGKIYENEDAMLADIRDGVYDYSCLKQFNERFNHAQTGDCSEKVIDIVFGEQVGEEQESEC